MTLHEIETANLKWAAGVSFREPFKFSPEAIIAAMTGLMTLTEIALLKTANPQCAEARITCPPDPQIEIVSATEPTYTFVASQLLEEVSRRIKPFVLEDIFERNSNTMLQGLFPHLVHNTPERWGGLLLRSRDEEVIATLDGW